MSTRVVPEIGFAPPLNGVRMSGDPSARHAGGGLYLLSCHLKRFNSTPGMFPVAGMFSARTLSLLSAGMTGGGERVVSIPERTLRRTRKRHAHAG